MTKTSQKLTPKTAAQSKLRSASPPVSPPASPPGQTLLNGDADNQALYSDAILRLYRKVGMNKARPLSTAFQQSFQDLLPAVVRDEIDLPTLAAFKEITPDLLKQRFTGLLTPHGLTWAAIERMSHAHKEALYQLLIRVPAG